MGWLVWRVLGGACVSLFGGGDGLGYKSSWLHVEDVVVGWRVWFGLFLVDWAG